MEVSEERFWVSSDLEDEPTLGERVEVQKRERTERATANVSTLNYSRRAAPETTAKRKKKDMPREISSKKPVPFGRERCLGIIGDSNGKERSVKKRFDPRFEEHCGELREDHVERNYSFVQGLREKRRSELQKIVRKNPHDETASSELVQIAEDDNRRRALLRRREILKKIRDEEKEAVRRGKKPYFLKEAAVRKLEIEAKFKELKESGGVKKYIEKRRRRLASKDRKLLPNKRPNS